jgi:hypothetical protein
MDFKSINAAAERAGAVNVKEDIVMVVLMATCC